MSPLKEMFNPAFYRQYASVFSKVYPKFDDVGFYRDAKKNLEQLELNARLRRTTETLRKYLPGDYNKAIDILYKATPGLRKGYTALVLPDFVGLYGHDHFELSMHALKSFTSLGSSEFAIRTFLKSNLKKTLAVMEQWATDDDPHVRRLASEGSRPRLPWSFKLDAIVKDPKLTRNILEILKDDPELYVRKSVANHLNDISKDHPDYMIKTISAWDLTNAYTAWIVKHASRSLIKKGNADSLRIFKFEKNVNVTLSPLKLNTAAIKIGDVLAFSFTIRSNKSKPQKLVVDYAVHYPKASGQVSRKVFKLKEWVLDAGSVKHISKKQPFKDLTTRKHAPGKHELEILVNGKEYQRKSFMVSR